MVILRKNDSTNSGKNQVFDQHYAEPNGSDAKGQLYELPFRFSRSCVVVINMLRLI